MPECKVGLALQASRGPLTERTQAPVGLPLQGNRLAISGSQSKTRFGSLAKRTLPRARAPVGLPLQGNRPPPDLSETDL